MPLAHLPPTTRPLGGLSKPWALPHPRSPRGRGAGDAYGLTPAPQPQSVGSPPTSKGQAATRFASQALTGFLLRPLRIVLLHPRRWKGVKGDAVVHFTLDALESTQHSAQGNVDRFCHMPLRPLQVRVGFGAKPQVLLFGFWLGKLKIIPKKKRCSLCRILEC